MAWTIILEGEDKNIISSLSNEFTIVSNSNLREFKLLQYLDPYGDTIFNHLQMNDLIQDLQSLKLMENNLLINEVQLLAESCKNKPHTYLVFYGD